VLELVETWDVARLVAQLADDLTNRNLGAVHQHCPNRRAQRADSFEQADTRFAIDTRIDQHQVEILETALTDRALRVDRRTHIDALLVSEVRRHSAVTGVEIDDEQPDGRIHRGSEVARTRPQRTVAQSCLWPRRQPRFEIAGRRDVSAIARVMWLPNVTATSGEAASVQAQTNCPPLPIDSLRIRSPGFNIDRARNTCPNPLLIACPEHRSLAE